MCWENLGSQIKLVFGTFFLLWVWLCRLTTVGDRTKTTIMCVTPQNRGVPLTTCGIVVDVGLPDTTHENRAESPLYGELYPRYITCPNHTQRPHRVQM